MKNALTFLALTLFALSTFAGSAPATWISNLSDHPEIQALSPAVAELSMEEFVDLSVKDYKAMTDERLTLKERIQFKAAQKLVEQQLKPNAEIEKSIYVLLAIFGLGWLGMGLNSDFEGSDWIICLVLYAVLFLPGFIYALIKMKEYY